MFPLVAFGFVFLLATVIVVVMWMDPPPKAEPVQIIERLDIEKTQLNEEFLAFERKHQEILPPLIFINDYDSVELMQDAYTQPLKKAG